MVKRVNVQYLVMILMAVMLLMINYYQGNILGFKAFLYPSTKLVNQRISLASTAFEAKEGKMAIVNRHQSYFIGEIIKDDNQLYLIQDNISVKVDDEIVYIELFSVNVISIVVIGFIMSLVMGGAHGKFRVKKKT